MKIKLIFTVTILLLIIFLRDGFAGNITTQKELNSGPVQSYVNNTEPKSDLISAADKLFQQNQLESAISSYKLLLYKYPRDKKIQTRLCRSIEKKINVLRTIKPVNINNIQELYYELMVINPNNLKYRQASVDLERTSYPLISSTTLTEVNVHLNNSYNAKDERNYVLAVTELEKVVSLNADKVTYRLLLATAYRDAGKIDRAIITLHQAKRKFPDSKPVQNLLTQINQSYRTITEYTNASDTDTVTIDTQVKVAAAYLNFGNPDKAIQILTGLITQNVTEKWPVYLLLSSAYARTGKYHDAYDNLMQDYMFKSWNIDPSLKSVPIKIYKTQMEDLNSIDLIALKWRTLPDLIVKANGLSGTEYIEDYTFLVIPQIFPSHLPVPATGYVSSHFGWRLHPVYATWKLHAGIDIETRDGTPAYAILAGEVVVTGEQTKKGKYVKLKHQNGITTEYLHAAEILVKPGQRVNPGDKIIITGRTGTVVSNHLHFEVSVNGIPTDPIPWF